MNFVMTAWIERLDSALGIYHGIISSMDMILHTGHFVQHYSAYFYSISNIHD